MEVPQMDGLQWKILLEMKKRGTPYFTKPPICLVVSFMDHHHDVSLLVMCFYSYIKYYDRCQRILKKIKCLIIINHRCIYIANTLW